MRFPPPHRLHLAYATVRAHNCDIDLHVLIYLLAPHRRIYIYRPLRYISICNRSNSYSNLNVCSHYPSKFYTYRLFFTSMAIFVSGEVPIHTFSETERRLTFRGPGVRRLAEFPLTDPVWTTANPPGAYRLIYDFVKKVICGGWHPPIEFLHRCIDARTHLFSSICAC